MRAGKITVTGYLNLDNEVAMNEYIIELSDSPDKTNVLPHFISALDFLDGREEFSKAELQRYLKCGYGTVCKILDAMFVLCVVDKVVGTSNTYRKSDG